MDKSALIKEYLPLVKSIAAKYCKRGVSRDDLMQEGLLGLLEAAERYQTDRETKFSSYAVFWIKKYVLQYLHKECRSTRDSVSLDAIPEDGKSLEETLPEQAQEQSGSGRLSVPGSVTNLEEVILRQFFEEHKTLNEIALLLGVRRERVRQLRQKALRKMKAQSHDQGGSAKNNEAGLVRMGKQ